MVSKGSGYGGGRSSQPPWAPNGGRQTSRSYNRRASDKTKLKQSIHDETHHHWMQMITRGLHQSMGAEQEDARAVLRHMAFSIGAPPWLR